jgi:hypothetical protein
MTKQTFSDPSERFHARILSQGEQHAFQCRKYMEIGKFLDLLAHRRLPLSRVDTFSDKAEAQIGLELKKKYILDRVDWYERRLVLATDNAHADKSIVQSIEALRDDLETALDDEGINASLAIAHGNLKQTGFKSPLLRPFIPASANEYLHEWYCFSCCGPNSDLKPNMSVESYLMWKTYVPSGKGVSFTFNSLELLKAIEDPAYDASLLDTGHEPHIYFGKVDYSGQEARDIEDAVFSKRAYYKDENEVRYAKRSPNGGYEPVIYCDLSLSLPPLIQEITFSPFMSRWEVDTYVEVIETIWHKNFDEVASIPPILASQVERA